ncbi:MAG TPA: hypothetical protein VIU11_23375 [Nakamurella sp.]
MPPGGRRPGAGRPAGAKDREPRIRLLSNEERRLVDSYRREHADLALSGRAKAIRCLIDIVENTKADAKDRVKAAATLLGQTGGIAVTVGVGVQVGDRDDQASAAALVMARLDALAAADLAERTAAEQADPFGDILGDVAPCTGLPWIAELTAAAGAEPAEPEVIDAVAVDARGAQSESDGARVGSPHPDPVRHAAAQPATAAAAWTPNTFGPDGLDIGSSPGLVGSAGSTPVDTAPIPAPVDTGTEPAGGLVDAGSGSARVHVTDAGYVITTTGKGTGSGVPTARSTRTKRPRLPRDSAAIPPAPPSAQVSR